MAAETPLYLTSVSNGHVLARSPTGQPSAVVVQNRGDQDLAQKWIVETGSSNDIIALRCLSNNEYLRADGGTNWATVGTGEKQWWKCSGENVTAPQACKLSPVDYPGVFLNHFQGIRVAKGQSMKVHMWQWEQQNEFCLTWYFCNAGGPITPSPTNQGEVEAEDNKQAHLPQPGATGSKIRELESKLARQSRELEEQKTKLKQHLEKQKAEQKKTPRPEPVTASSSSSVPKKTPRPEPVTASSSSSVPKSKPKPLPAPSKKVTVPATNGVSKEMDKDHCKHVVLPPPRKIRRKVVGIIYANDDGYEGKGKGIEALPPTWRDEKPKKKDSLSPTWRDERPKKQESLPPTRRDRKGKGRA